MEYPDENDLPDRAISAMWDEGEPVELAAGPERTVVEIAPSRWSWPAPGTTVAGRIMRWVFDLKSFGAATTHHPVSLADASDNPTAARSA
jgi:hypothetical protein